MCVTFAFNYHKKTLLDAVHRLREPNERHTIALNARAGSDLRMYFYHLYSSLS